ncbi:MAG TPA: nucleotide exchange factor GrpE [Bacteroidota bacterium]|nr:nucleotide exchange factor GrpE [Bacteroidota bacterium]
MIEEQDDGGRTLEAAPGDGGAQGTGEPGSAGTPPPAGGIERDLEAARAAAQSARDQFLRKAAEFENYKRRTEAEFAAVVRNANESLIASLLPIVEDLVRSLKAAASRGEDDAFTSGVELIYQKLMKALEARGLAPFDSLGKPFNVDEHDALLQVPRADVPPGTVVEEIARGYRLNDRVIRHARVVVSSAPPDGAPQDEPPAKRGSAEAAEN